jgi:hypothetical protein
MAFRPAGAQGHLQDWLTRVFSAVLGAFRVADEGFEGFPARLKGFP